MRLRDIENEIAENKLNQNTAIDSVDDLDEARGAIRGALAGVALLATLWGVDEHFAQKAYDASPQLQKLTAYLEVAKEHNDKRMIDQLEKRIEDHKQRLRLGKGDVLDPRGQPIDVVYDKSMREAKKKITKSEDPCWKGYHMVGTKTKGGKQVPNCVPGKKG